MTCFESGFIKEASTQGLEQDYALELLKRALEHPEASSMFKQLPQDADGADPDSIEMLKEMLKQDLIDQQMQAGRRQIMLA
jgi:hypothetical protein